MFVMHELSQNQGEFMTDIFAKHEAQPLIINSLQQVIEEGAAGKIRQVDPIHLLMNTMSMIVFPYNARAYGEVNYTLSDGGRLEARKKLKTAKGQLPNQQLELERFALRKRINHLFLGVLLSRERVMVFETTGVDAVSRDEFLDIKLGVHLPN